MLRVAPIRRNTMLLSLIYSQSYILLLSSSLSAICLTTTGLRHSPPRRYNYPIYSDPQRTPSSCAWKMLMQISSLPSGIDGRRLLLLVSSSIYTNALHRSVDARTTQPKHATRVRWQKDLCVPAPPHWSVQLSV